MPFPSPGDLPNPGIEPRSPILQADSLPSEPPGKPTQAMSGGNPVWPRHCEHFPHKPVIFVCSVLPSLDTLCPYFCQQSNSSTVFKGDPKVAALIKTAYPSLVTQRLKNLPPMQETWVLSLDWEDPLEKEKVTHSSILGWRIPWTEKPGRLQSMGSQRVAHN